VVSFLLVRKAERKRSLGSPKRKWEDNIKIHLRGIGWIGFMWVRIGTSGSLLYIRQ
jgi:hypothetical protein